MLADPRIPGQPPVHHVNSPLTVGLVTATPDVANALNTVLSSVGVHLQVSSDPVAVLSTAWARQPFVLCLDGQDFQSAELAASQKTKPGVGRESPEVVLSPFNCRFGHLRLPAGRLRLTLPRRLLFRPEALVRAMRMVVNGQGGVVEVPRGCYVVTPRQAEVLDLMARGYSNAEIGRRLHCENRALERVIARLYNALDLSDRRDVNRRSMAALLLDRGLIAVSPYPVARK